MSSILNKIALSLKENNSDPTRKKWAQYIIDNNIPLLELVPLIDFEHPVGMRFSWIIGELCSLKPTIVFPVISYLFLKSDSIQIKNFDRSLAKMFALVGVPGEIEGMAIDQLFKWLTDPKITVSTKHFALWALENQLKKHPDLKNELKIVLEEQLHKNTAAFAKLVTKTLKKL